MKGCSLVHGKKISKLNSILKEVNLNSRILILVFYCKNKDWNTIPIANTNYME
jgi:hypothetical protein